MAATNPVEGRMHIQVAFPCCQADGDKWRPLDSGHAVEVDGFVLSQQCPGNRKGLGESFMAQGFLATMIGKRDTAALPVGRDRFPSFFFGITAAETALQASLLKLLPVQEAGRHGTECQAIGEDPAVGQ